MLKPLFTLPLFLLSLSAAAASPSPQPSASPATTTTTPKAKTLWDSWYTVTAEGGVPYGYYNDRFERKGDRIAFKNQFWKREEGYINEEQVVAIASDNEFLSPEFWNFRSSYRATTIDIDGTAKGNQVSVKIRQNSKDAPSVSRSIPGKTFVSVMFPVWLGKRLSTMKVSEPHSFQVIFEDSVDRKFAPLSGIARLAAPDDTAKRTGTSKVTVDIDGRKSVWYVLPSGEPVRIEMTSHHLTVNRVPESEARRFLMGKD